jgi:uncharacterized FAD-dependent dehydrogenase
MLQNQERLACTNSKDPISYEHVQRASILGEGAGYAGGIISAAIDGEKCCHDWRKFK